MKPVNLVFEYDYEDVDILLVPDFVHDNIGVIVQEFFDSLPSGKEGEVQSIETEDFLNWLNKKYYFAENRKATLIVAHTKYNPDYPTADF